MVRSPPLGTAAQMPTAELNSRPQVLPRLTSLRAFAALGVFGFHAARIFEWMPGDLTLRLGYVGVAFFFILSGFVLTWSTHGQAPDPREFWVKRVARVYPAHLVMCFAALLAPLNAVESGAKGKILSVLLLQAWFPDNDVAFALNAVSWSLSVEAAFYLVAPWLIAGLQSRRSTALWAIAAVWWGITATIGLILVLEGRDVWAYTLPLVRSGEFTLGVALAEGLRRLDPHSLGFRVIPPMWIGVLLVVVGYAAALRASLAQTLTGFLMTPVFLVLIAAGAKADIQRRKGVLDRIALVHLGTVSYCFYLVHELVLVNIAPYLPPPVSAVERLLWIAILLAICQAGAELLHRLVEVPSQRWILSAWRSRRQQVAAPLRRAVDG